jgi:glutathione peroxidase
MKNFFLFILLQCSLLDTYAQTASNFHDYTVQTIEGNQISLSQYAGKKLLVVNTASYCGYTHQFTNLQYLYMQYGGPAFEILGFPCNDFGNQDPGSDSTINQFCTNNYDVTFQMMSSIHIKTGDTAEVYKWLQRGDLNGVRDARVTWNFNKFLIDEQGNFAGYYDSPTAPDDTAIVNWIRQEPIALGNATPKRLSTNVIQSHDQLTIEFDHQVTDSEIQISLISLTGQESMAPIYVSKGASTLQIPTTYLSSGIYFVQIIRDTEIDRHQITIAH